MMLPQIDFDNFHGTRMNRVRLQIQIQEKHILECRRGIDDLMQEIARLNTEIATSNGVIGGLKFALGELKLD